MERILFDEPLVVVTAGSAKEAWEVLDNSTIDAVISDQVMPGVRGTEFLSALRERYPSIVRFMLTGHPTLDVAMKAINEGAISKFFVKPVDPQELISSLGAALLERDLTLELREQLRRVRQQDAAIAALESEYPGISEIQKDGKGAIVIDDLPTSPHDLVEESRRLRLLLIEKIRMARGS
ncbi:MAG: response regulator [Candidatus Hydrogenedentes bacterium]|nr:response regulator [Candidatus Hydrogenedentota bacterium]